MFQLKTRGLVFLPLCCCGAGRRAAAPGFALPCSGHAKSSMTHTCSWKRLRAVQINALLPQCLGKAGVGARRSGGVIPLTEPQCGTLRPEHADAGELQGLLDKDHFDGSGSSSPCRTLVWGSSSVD